MSSLLEQEIHEQPQVVARLLEREAERARQIVADLPAFTHVLIAARGTSDYAATYAKYAWAALARYPVALATPSLHTLYETPARLWLGSPNRGSRRISSPCSRMASGRIARRSP
jgi:glucosamine--fructose-6-phosphate aminotransferase (isomerizing)